MKITREKPAARWGEAFPVGNGHLGGMLYGGIGTDRIDLSENTFYSGSADEKNNQPGADRAFRAMREAAVTEDFAGVREAAAGFMGVRGNYGTNLPVGSLLIETGLSEAEASGYERALDLTEGVVTSRWMQGGVEVRTRAFASHVRNVLYYEITAQEKLLQLRLTFASPREGDYVNYNIGGLYFECDARETLHSDGTCGVLLIGKAAIHTDGFPKKEAGGLTVKNASRLGVYILMATDFAQLRAGAGNAPAAPADGEPAAHTAESLALLSEITGGMEGGRLQRLAGMQMELNRRFVRFEGMKPEELYAEHAADMRNMAERVTLEVSGDGHVSEIPRMFQMGRYLLYSSSREDSALPAHLQGVWNDNVACRIGWTCDMHLDINTQMNYWPAEVTALPETEKPLFSWIRQDLTRRGAQTARVSYGLPGWAAELVSNAWGFAAPYWGRNLSPCPTGGAWLLTQEWEHYLVSQDRDFLKEELYPQLTEAARFFSAYVFPDGKGHLTCGPSISPENSFQAPDGREWQMSCGCTYELTVIRELFRIYLAASEELGVEDALTKKVRGQEKKLLPFRILADGMLAEWSHDHPAADPQHRHTSHLLGVYPFAQITPEKRKLAAAAENSIRAKLTPKEGWEDTGWARSMLMLYEARLRHPAEAWRHICAMLDGLLEPNGMIIHPPTRGAGAFDNVYELDGNTGLTACIAEMLMQSHGGVIRLLPALPREWKSGHVSGLMARGGVSVEISWKGRSCSAWLTAKKDGPCTVAKGRAKKTVTLAAGQRTRVW